MGKRDNLQHLRRLAGLREAEEYLDPDDADDMRTAELDAQRDRETKIERLIAQTFLRLDLPVEIKIGYKGERTPIGILYDEDGDREARVTLDDYEIDLAKLAPLLTSGLGTNFKVVAASEGIDVTFNVDANLDHVVDR